MDYKETRGRLRLLDQEVEQLHKKIQSFRLMLDQAEGRIQQLERDKRVIQEIFHQVIQFSSKTAGKKIRRVA